MKSWSLPKRVECAWTLVSAGNCIRWVEWVWWVSWRFFIWDRVALVLKVFQKTNWKYWKNWKHWVWHCLIGALVTRETALTLCRGKTSHTLLKTEEHWMVCWRTPEQQSITAKYILDAAICLSFNTFYMQPLGAHSATQHYIWLHCIKLCMLVL